MIYSTNGVEVTLGQQLILSLHKFNLRSAYSDTKDPVCSTRPMRTLLPYFFCKEFLPFDVFHVESNE